jgi:hypothetical protein
MVAEVQGQLPLKLKRLKSAINRDISLPQNKLKGAMK